MPQWERRRCIDTHVICSAECGSDHTLVAMRFCLGPVRWFKPTSARRPRFDVSRLLAPAPSSTEDQPRRNIDDYQDAINSGLDRTAETYHVVEPTGQWWALRSAMTAAAEGVLGWSRRRQPDWFLENQPVLEPVLSKRKNCYSEWIANGRREEDHLLHKQARTQARAAVQRAKNEWFAEQARNIEAGCFNLARV